jgi:hypothetical protein
MSQPYRPPRPIMGIGLHELEHDCTLKGVPKLYAKPWYFDYTDSWELDCALRAETWAVYCCNWCSIHCSVSLSPL